jgi:hypothetical protein
MATIVSALERETDHQCVPKVMLAEVTRPPFIHDNLVHCHVPQDSLHGRDHDDLVHFYQVELAQFLGG